MSAIRPKPRILIVDDDATICRLTELHLGQYDVQMDIARNGKEALQAVHRYSYALIIMDVCMPEMDGLEATKRIRQFEKAAGRHTPIVAVTAHPSSTEARMMS